MQKTKCKQSGENIASKTQYNTFEDGFGKSCESSLGALTKQIVSEVSETVVSLATFIGDTVLFECTGIFVENSCADVTSILTSVNIVGSSDYDITDNLTIKVRLPSDRVVTGWLHHCDFECDLAIVNIRRARGFQEAHLSSSHCVQSNGKVVAVGRCFDSGMLKTTDGIVVGSASDELCELVLSIYKINTDWIGCPLIDFDGYFVGMNLRSGERTAFVPMNKILECLGHTAADTNDTGGSYSWPEPNQYWVYPPFCMNQDLRSSMEEEAFPPELCVDQPVYFDTREEAFPPIQSLAWA